MKKINDLETALEEAANRFKGQMHFDLETFDQNRQSPYLTKDDMEEISRQTYYTFTEFKEHIIAYLKDNQK